MTTESEDDRMNSKDHMEKYNPGQTEIDQRLSGVASKALPDFPSSMSQFHEYIPTEEHESGISSGRSMDADSADSSANSSMISDRRSSRTSSGRVNYEELDYPIESSHLKRKRVSKSKSKASRLKKSKNHPSPNSSYSKKTFGASIPLPSSEVEMERILYTRPIEHAETSQSGEGMIVDTAPEYEYLIKFKNRSYLHCEWVTEQWVLSVDKRGKQRLQYFLQKTMNDLSYQLLSETQPFNENYVKIDRILDEVDAPDPFTNEYVHWYLVKWCSLPYEHATWDPEDVLFHECDDADLKIEEYRHRSLLPHERDPSYYKSCVPVGARPPIGWNKYEQSPKFKYGFSLRSYQLEGLNWLLYCWHHGQSCIMADEMGLGKTIQSVAFLNCLYKDVGVKGPFIIVAPLSTIPHWERTFNEWTDLNTVVYHGSAQSRSICQHYEFNYFDSRGKKVPVVMPPGYSHPHLATKAFSQFKFDVLITTYEMALASISTLRSVDPYRAIIVDEAHRLKNKNSKVTEVLKTLNCEYKVLLTGTPIQNSLEELWSILNFLDNQKFPDSSSKEFLMEHDLKSAADVEKLQALLKPLMLRRLKEDVEKSIPSKEETLIEIEMTDIQRGYYKAIIERNFGFLRQGAKSKNMPNLINVMLELRKCCIHPFLIKGAETNILNSAPDPENRVRHLIEASGKMVLLDKLLPKLKAGGHRVLIFSQMTKCLDLIGEFLRSKNYNFERIDGSIRGDARQASIDRFSAPESEVFAFLLCTRAGGVGINLTAADTCIIFDSDWNPQNDLQAQARCHRIGQKKNVAIYRLITRNTYEMNMFEKAGLKLGLDKAVLSRMDFDAVSSSTPSSLSKKEIEELLKKGAYGALANEENAREESESFKKEDIDNILLKRTQLIKHENGESKPSEPSIFSKATFSLENSKDHLELGDPNFWDKWAAKANFDTSKFDAPEEELILDYSRRRTRTERSEKTDLSQISDLEDDIDDDDTFGGELDGVARKEGYRLWSLAERIRVERGLMLFGFGAWEKKVESFSKRSINDIKAAELRLIKWCVERVKKDTLKPDGKYVRDDIRLFEDVQRAVSVNRWEVPTIDEIDDMTENSCEKCFLEKEYGLEEDPEYGKYPYPGATKKDLIEYYSFLDDCPSSYIERLDKKPKNILMRVQLFHFLRESIFDLDPWAVGDIWVEDPDNSSDMINKYDSMFSSRQLRHQFHPNYQSLFAGESKIADWGSEEDRDMLLGIIKYGYQAYESMRADSQLIFIVRKWGSNYGGSDQTSRQWPSGAELGIRLRKLMAFLQKYSKRKWEGNVSLESRGVSSKSDNVWPKKLRSFFTNALNILGAPEEFKAQISAIEAKNSPWSIIEINEEENTALVYRRDWIKFREEANLSFKSEEACEIFFKCFMRKTEEILNEKYPKEVRYVDRIWPFDHSDVVEEEDPLSRFKLIDGGGIVVSPNDGVADERIRRLSRRIWLFHTIRSLVLTEPNVVEIIKRLKSTTGLPSWWIVGDFDIAFIKGVAKHGMTPLKQNLILFDPEFPFKEILLKKLEEDGLTQNLERLRQLMTLTKDGLRALGTEFDDDKASDAEERHLLNGKNIEEYLGWPKDLIRSRRVETLVDLVVRLSDRSIKMGLLPSSKDTRKRLHEASGFSSSSNLDLMVDSPAHQLLCLTKNSLQEHSDMEIPDENVRYIVSRLRGALEYIKSNPDAENVANICKQLKLMLEKGKSEEGSNTSFSNEDVCFYAE